MKPAGWHSNQWGAGLQVIKSIYEFVDLFILFITERWVCFFPFRTIRGSNVSILTPLINTDYFQISEREIMADEEWNLSIILFSSHQ